MSLDQQLDIIHRAVVDCEPHLDLAKEFNVTLGRITQIVSKARKKPSFLRELIAERAER